MRKNRGLFVCLIASLIALLLLAINERNRAVVSASNAAARARIAEAYEKLPMSFEANRGQANEAVKFLARGDGYNLSLATSEAVLLLRASNKPGQTPRTTFLRMKFAGANPLPRIEGMDEMASRSHYLIGNDQSRWRRDVPHYAKVRYREIYRGVDLVFYGNQRQIEYDFILQPGANPAAIKLEFEGVDRMEIDAGGDLLLGLAGEEIRQRKPVVYQEINGERRTVESRYVRLGKNRIGFRVASYDRRLPLVIDPVLIYSSYLGGSIAVDAGGNIYIAGSAASPDFPTVNSLYPFQGTKTFFVSVNGGESWSEGKWPMVGLTPLAIAIDPKKPSTLYAGTEEGVFKTTDGGETWAEKNAGLGQVYIFSLSIDPANPDTIYANTEGKGLVKSADGGDHWSGPLGVTAVKFLVIDPVATATIYALSTADNKQRLYKSVNGGGSWTLVALDPAIFEVKDLAIDPRNNNTLYLNAGRAGVWKSADGGGSWTAINSGLEGQAIASLAIDPKNPATLYASGAKVFKTADGGGSWSAISNRDNLTALMVDPLNSTTIYARFGSNIFKSVDGGANWTGASPEVYGSLYGFAIDPADSSKLYVGRYRSSGGEIFVSKLNPAGTALIFSTFIGGSEDESASGIALDGEGNVSIIGSSRSPDFPLVNAFQRSGERIFLKSTDDGKTWAAAGALPRRGKLSVDPVNTSTLYVNALGNRVYKSTDGGVTWNLSSNGLPGYESALSRSKQSVVIDPVNPATLYLAVDTANFRGAVYKGTDGGATWRESSAGLVCSDITILVIDPRNPATLHAGTQRDVKFGRGGGGVFKTTDGGANWTQVSIGLADDPNGGKASVISLAIDPTNSSTLYAGISESGLYKSTDGGASWNRISDFRFGYFNQPLIVDPSNPSVLYAGSYYGHVFKSVDGGASWNAVNNGMPEFRFLSGPILAMNPVNPSSLYAWVYTGSANPSLYKTTDAAANWTLSSDGLGSRQIHSLAIDPKRPSTLYVVATGDSGPVNILGAGAIAMKLNRAGSALLFSTYVEGRLDGVAADRAGNTYVAGSTYSSSFPVTPNAVQKTNKGAADAIVMKFDPTGGIGYATYLGGNAIDGVTGIAADGDGTVHVAGFSDSEDFPTTAGAFQTTGKGSFVAKLNSSGSGLPYSTRFGGKETSCTDVAVDAMGNAWVTGFTAWAQFPVTSDAYQRAISGISDAFIAQFNQSASSLLYATYLGGGGNDRALSLELDAAGNVYLSGSTTGSGFPVTSDALKASYTAGVCGYILQLPNPIPIPCSNGFVTVLDVAGKRLRYSSYLGGSKTDLANSVAVDSSGNFYVSGRAESPDFPFTANGFQLTRRTGTFLAKFSPGDANAVASVSAASYQGTEIARASIVAAFGSNLSTSVQASTATPLPTSLAGTTVEVRDSAGAVLAAPLFFVAPAQVNYQLPQSAATGSATVAITGGNGMVSIGAVQIASVAPGVFTANANGQGVPAAVVQRVRADGSQSYEMLARYDQSSKQWVSIPIDLGPDVGNASDQVFLSLFGTGWRFRSSELAVKVTIGGVEAPLLYAGLQPTLTGVDQINLRLPRSLAGKGEVDLVVTADGKMANMVKVNIK